MSLKDLLRFSKPVPAPTANVSYKSTFLANPAPLNDIFYNSDEAFRANPENASRMLLDPSIFASLQERLLASAELPWSILPEDEEDVRQRKAAEHVQRLIMRTPNLTDFILNLGNAVWNGRQGTFIDWDWDFRDGKQSLYVKKWTPIHGDSLLFGENGEVGYRVGSPTIDVVDEIISTVEGRGILISDDEREAWVIHNYQKTAGEFRIFTSAASQFGVGLRSRLAYVWQLKQELLVQLQSAAEKFGTGWIVGYYQMGNQQSYTEMFAGMKKQVGSCVQLFPRQSGEDSSENIEVKNPPAGLDSMLAIIQEYDNQIRQTICGQTLTAEAGSTGLGSNLASVHQTTFGRLVRYDALAMQETLTRQFVAVIQKYSGYGDLPPLRWEFSFDLGDPAEKLQKALILQQLGVKVAESELLQAAGFTAPLSTEDKSNEEQIPDAEIVEKEEVKPKKIYKKTKSTTKLK